MMKYAILTLLISCLFGAEIVAQDKSNTIVDKDLSIQFTVPEGWTVTKKESGYLMGSSTTSGFMMLEIQSFDSLNQLKTAMEAGIEQKDGTMLMPSGDLRLLGDQGVSGMYKGKIDGEEMTGFMMALFPPYEKKAAICISVAPSKLFNQSNMDQLKMLLRSIIFL